MHRLEAFADVGLNEALLRLLIAGHARTARPRSSASGATTATHRIPRNAHDRPRLAQEEGLPLRLRRATPHHRRPHAREVVIENDIAWRIQSMVDFMFGKPARS
jgi:hypothetical protein